MKIWANLIPSCPAAVPKTCTVNFECRIKSHKHTTFAVELEGRLLRDEGEIKVTKLIKLNQLHKPELIKLIKLN